MNATFSNELLCLLVDILQKDGIIIINKSKMMSSQGEYHYLFKVVLVGNSCVGKSSIVVRYADD